MYTNANIIPHIHRPTVDFNKIPHSAPTHKRQVLTYWGRDKIPAISQATFSKAFSWMNRYEFRSKFHCSLFLRVQLTIFQYWFSLVGAKPLSEPMMLRLPTHICVGRLQWVNTKSINRLWHSIPKQCTCTRLYQQVIFNVLAALIVLFYMVYTDLEKIEATFIENDRANNYPNVQGGTIICQAWKRDFLTLIVDERQICMG